MNDLEKEKLCDMAKQVAFNSYSPYSNFRVGVAVLGDKGIYVGVNVENASLGLTICAERIAIASAISNGDTNIHAIAIACIDASDGGELSSKLPCGACRQWIAELAPKAHIIICGVEQIFSLSDFLPMPFQLP